MYSNHLWTETHRNDWTDFFYSSLFKSYCVVNLTRSTQNWFRGCISAEVWSIETKIGTLHRKHDLRFHAKVGNSATYGHEIWKIAILANNCWTVCALILLLLFFFRQWKSMAALWTEHRKMMKFGTLLVMLMNSNWTNFWASRTNSIAPPPVQKFNIEMVITFEPFDLEKWNLVHLIPLIILITTNTLH